jgi:Peptidase family M23
MPRAHLHDAAMTWGECVVRKRVAVGMRRLGKRTSMRHLLAIACAAPVAIGTAHAACELPANAGQLKDLTAPVSYPRAEAACAISTNSKCFTFHHGSTGGGITVDPQSKVIAAQSGEVVASRQDEFGWSVTIGHGGGFETLYSWLTGLKDKISVGACVAKGHVIAVGGGMEVAAPQKRIQFKILLNGKSVFVAQDYFDQDSFVSYRGPPF